jgi:colanic acid/amylovoran biosynthesis glycosyltransferase
MPESEQTIRIAFVTGIFPGAPGAFVLNQVADLVDRGVEVTVFTRRRDTSEEIKSVSKRYHDYRMSELVHTLEIPRSRIERLWRVPRKIVRVFRHRPFALLKIFNVFRYGKDALSLKTLFWTEPFVGRKFDIYHCHFGSIAVKFLTVKEILGLTEPLVVTFYGYDVSQVFAQKGKNYYDRLIKEADLYFTMSENMKERILPYGFPAEKIFSLPVSVDVPSYPFAERAHPKEGPIRIVSVGRFVAKKGFDDLLRALAALKKKTKEKFLCFIVGEGVEHDSIHAIAKDLGVEDVVVWQKFMPEQELVKYYMDKHLYVQTSKTAPNGDME